MRQARFRALDINGRDIAPVILWELGSDVKTVHTSYYLNVLGRAIAVEIRNLISGGIADLKPSDIFILTRKESEGRRVAAFLRDAGLPFAFYKLNGLFQTPQAEHIRDLLLAVEHPFDESRRLRAWMTPFFGVPIDQLLHCKGLPESDLWSDVCSTGTRFPDGGIFPNSFRALSMKAGWCAGSFF